MHRRLPALALAAAVVAVTVVVSTLHDVPTSIALARRAEPTATPPTVTMARGCRVETARNVDAAKVTLTDTIAVTLSVRGCLPQISPVHVVFVVDADVLDGDAVRDVREAVNSVLDALELPLDPYNRVAVVGFGTAVRVLAPLTHVRSRILAGVSRALRPPGDALAAGIEQATSVLLQARRASSRPDSIHEVIIIFSPAVWERGTCGPATSAAGVAKGQGIRVVTALTGDSRDNELSCFRSMATSPRYFFERHQLAFVGRMFVSTHRSAAATLPIRVAITDTVAPMFEVDPTTVDPPPHAPSPDGRTLRWQLPVTITWPADAITVTYRLRPTALGIWPVSLGATAVVTDSYSIRWAIGFPNATVEVIDPASTVTLVCPATHSAVPADVIAAALAHPERVSGWGQRCSPNQPSGPANPLRQSLRLARPGMAYHPAANGVLWACGCR